MVESSIRIGMLTPSSNTVLEPMTQRIVSGLGGVSAHFSRFRVTEIALDSAAVAQFDLAPMLEAARLLADARVDVICWNGTSASWLGLEADRRLVDAITAETRIPAASCVLSLVEAFREVGIRRYALVTPYTSDVQDRIVDNLSGEGFECVSEVHFDIRDNFSFALVKEETIASGVKQLATGGVEAIVILCTNLAGAGAVQRLETETGVPVLDSVAITVWGALKRIGQGTQGMQRWGRRLASS